MGRTEPTFRLILDGLEHEWNDYRRGLDARDAAAFDGVLRRARAHASASMNAARAVPLEAVFMSVLVEHEREIGELRKRVAVLQGGL